MPDTTCQFSLSHRFSKEACNRLEAGFLPEDMSDRWLVRYEAPELAFYRSWSGHCIYRLQLSPLPDGGAEAIGLTVNGDPEQYKAVSETHRETEIANFDQLLNMLFGLTLLK